MSAKRGTTRWMSDLHEEYLAEVFDGQVQPGSGNQFNAQMDVRNHPTRTHPFAVDGKSTFGKSISISLDMIAKADEQAHDVNPAIALRWYPDQTGRNTTDWVAIPADVFRNLLADARWAYEGDAETEDD